MHEALIPPDSLDGCEDDEIVHWKTEYDVVSTLREMGHDVHVAGVQADLSALSAALDEVKPHITFNLLEEFHNNSLYDHHITGYLELLRQAYTGCNPRGLMITHDKALSKKILAYHHICTPRFQVIPRGVKARISRHLNYPLIVKSLTEDGSFGIAHASVVQSEDKCLERIAYLHDGLKTPVIVEEFIEGRELYVAVLGNHRTEVLPTLEMNFGNVVKRSPRIATARVKWDWQYAEERAIEIGVANDLDDGLRRHVQRLARRIYRVLDITGYARIDFRVNDKGEVFVLEANANPDLAYGSEVSEAAEAANISYPRLLQKVLNLGLGYHRMC